MTRVAGVGPRQPMSLSWVGGVPLSRPASRPSCRLAPHTPPSHQTDSDPDSAPDSALPCARHRQTQQRSAASAPCSVLDGGDGRSGGGRLSGRRFLPDARGSQPSGAWTPPQLRAWRRPRHPPAGLSGGSRTCGVVLGVTAGNLSRVSRHSAGWGAEETLIWVSGLREALWVAWEDVGRS